MVARRVDVNLYVCNPIAFSQPNAVVENFSGAGPSYFSPEALDFAFVKNWDYRDQSTSRSYLEIAKSAGLAGCVLAGNQAASAWPYTQWKTYGVNTNGHHGGATHSVHLAGQGQVVQPSVSSLSFTALAVTVDPYESIDDCLGIMRGLLMGPLGNDIGAGGQLVIEGAGYTVENPSQLLEEYSMTIMGLVQQMSSSVEVDASAPSLLTQSGSSLKIHEYDVNCSATLSMSKGVVGYVTEGSPIFKSPRQRQDAVAVVYNWLHENATRLRLAMLQAASDGNAVPSSELQLSARPAEMMWLTQEELDAVEAYIESLQRLRMEGNDNLAGAVESLQAAYDDYVESVPEGESALSKEDWLNQLIETANAADEGLDNKAWYESMWSVIEGFGSSTLDFVEENPGLAAGIGGAVGVTTGVIDSRWLLVGGAIALLLLLD